VSDKAKKEKMKQDFGKLPKPIQTIVLYVIAGVVIGSVIPIIGNIIGGVVGLVLAVRKIM